MAFDGGHDDIPGSRDVIEENTSPFTIAFLAALAFVSAVLLLAGLASMDRKALKGAPDWLVLTGAGLAGFSLFFPWFTALYFARHLLSSVARLERRVDELERGRKAGQAGGARTEHDVDLE